MGLAITMGTAIGAATYNLGVGIAVFVIFAVINYFKKGKKAECKI